MIGTKKLSKLHTKKSSTGDENLFNIKLQEKISEVTLELEGSYKGYLNEIHHQNGFTESSQTGLKAELNKLIAENQEKQKTLTSFSKEIEALTGRPFLSGNSMKNEKSETDPLQEKLEKELLKATDDIEYVEREKNCIKGMLRKEKESIIILQERLAELTEAHRKITKSYSQVTYSNKKA